MQRVRIDIAVFSSPTAAFGNAKGEWDVEVRPKEHEAFPWPADWLAEKPAYFSPDQARIWSVTDVGGQVLVMLYGIVCNSIAEARDCAAFLEQRGGLFFDEYEQPIPSGEV
jgi:hypothetical protein